MDEFKAIMRMAWDGLLQGLWLTVIILFVLIMILGGSFSLEIHWQSFTELIDKIF